MANELLAALAAEEAVVEIGGKKAVVRQMGATADGAAFLDNTDFGYKLMVRCVFREDGETPWFTDDDIPALKRAAKVKLKPLMDAVLEVNGLNIAAQEKNSDAGQPSG
jgi:hypothetical protein